MATLIFKALESCNSNCIYCDVIQKHKTHVLEYDLLELIFHRINDYLFEFKDKEFTFNWHGGEVCLLGAEYFEKAFQLQESICINTKNRITHVVQSNITLLTQDIINAFKKLGIKSVGSSFDPLPGIRGMGPSRDSEQYMKKFFRGFELLRQNKMGCGIIYVVHRRSLEKPLEILQYLSNFKNISGIQLSKSYIYHEDKHNLSITMEEFAHFMGTIFAEWYSKQDIYPDITPLNSFLNSAKTGRCKMSCMFSGYCSQDWINITPDGTASQCGRTGDFEVAQMGNIKDKSLKELFADPLKNELATRSNKLLTSACKGCKYWFVCHGGCPLDAFMQHGSFMEKADECEWIKIFMAEYFEPITGYKF